MKQLSVILAFFYLFSAVGYGAEVHYCLGQVSDVTFIWFDASCACDDVRQNESIKRTMNCCEDERFFNQIEDEHAANVAATIIKGPPATVTLQHAEPIAPLNETNNVFEISDRAPPKPLDKLIAHHQLVFYA